MIPEDWEVVKLAEVCAMKSGEGITSANIDQFSKYPCFGGNGLRGFTTRFTHNGRYALIGRQGALCGNVLGVEGRLFASEHAIVVTATTQTDIRWLTFVLGNMRLNQYSESSAQPGLSVSKLLSLDVACPPTKAEQEAIAEALSDADALIESLEQLLTKKRHLKQGAMQELLTGKNRLPGFEVKPGYKQIEIGVIPEDWECVAIGNSINLLTGFPFSSKGYTQSGVRLLRGSNVKRGNTDWSEEGTEFWPAITSEIRKYVLKDGDIVIAMDGSLVGRSFAMLSESDVPAILLQRVARIRSEYIEQKFLKAWICSQRFTEHCDAVKTVTAIPHISPADIKSFNVALPPTKAEQEAIASILSDMDAEIAALEAKLAKTRQLKQGMMQELLTGRIRLV